MADEFFYEQRAKRTLLQPEELKKAAAIEAEIRGADYMVGGFGLYTILTEQLYIGDFADYTLATFRLPRHTAYRRMRAYLAAETVQKAGMPVPKNEAIAHVLAELDVRNLRTLDSKKIVEAWTAVRAKYPDPTANNVRELTRPPKTVADKLREGLKQMQAANKKMHELLREQTAVDPSFMQSLVTTIDAANDLTSRFRHLFGKVEPLEPTEPDRDYGLSYVYRENAEEGPELPIGE